MSGSERSGLVGESERPGWLPAWSVVSWQRLAHIERVTALLERWGEALALGSVELGMWRDAGRYHDALRDAPESTLRALTGDQHTAVSLLHGPAAAVRLLADGEARMDLVSAVRYHTVGSPNWGRLGRALYMADYLEPGRSFAREERALLAERVPSDFDGVFQEVLSSRLQWGIRSGYPLAEATVALWNLNRAAAEAR